MAALLSQKVGLSAPKAAPQQPKVAAPRVSSVVCRAQQQGSSDVVGGARTRCVYQ